MKRKLKQFNPYQYNYNHLKNIDVGTHGSGLGQTHNATGLNLLTESQPQPSDNLMSN
jgi:hypothetical protein